MNWFTKLSIALIVVLGLTSPAWGMLGKCRQTAQLGISANKKFKVAPVPEEVSKGTQNHQFKSFAFSEWDTAKKVFVKKHEGDLPQLQGHHRTAYVPNSGAYFIIHDSYEGLSIFTPKGDLVKTLLPTDLLTPEEFKGLTIASVQKSSKVHKSNHWSQDAGVFSEDGKTFTISAPTLRKIRLDVATGNVLAAKKPEAPADEKLAARIQKWIEQLETDDLTGRDKAAGELRSIGDAVVPALDSALKTTEDKELKSRLKDLLDHFEVSPLKWIEQCMKEELKGEYGPRRGATFEVLHPGINRQLASHRVFQIWDQNTKPSNWIILTYNKSTRKVTRLRKWEDLASHFRPALSDTDRKEQAVILAWLTGSCRISPLPHITADTFKVSKNGKGHLAVGTFSEENHIDYAWNCQFSEAGKITVFTTTETHALHHR